MIKLHLTDTHAHIYSNQFKNDRAEMLERTFEAGVQSIFMPNVDSENIEAMIDLEQKYAGRCWAMMGLHPCSVDENFEKELAIAESWLQKRKFCAIGEMGFDTYWDVNFVKQQLQVFEIQADWAKKYNLPLIIHCRGKEGDGAMDKTIAMIEKLQDGNLYGILHCFTGTYEQAQKLLQLNFKLGIGGVVTYKKSGLDEVVRQLDLQHIVLETDSPYLAPVPYRGKRNETSYLRLIAEKVAEIKQVDLATVAQITTANAFALFKTNY